LGLLIVLSSCSSSGSQNRLVTSSFKKTYTYPAASNQPLDSNDNYGSFVKVGETENTVLFYSEEEDCINLHNKASKAVWSSSLDWEAYNMGTPNPIQKAVTSSMLALTYSDIVANEGKLNTVYSGYEPSKRTVSGLKNGIAITYYFNLLQLQLTLHITLENDELVIAVPSESIKEGNRYLLMSLQILPAFGASYHTDKGYIFYPDGSGALLRYENYRHRTSGQASQTLSLGIYGPYDSEIYDYYVNTPIYDYTVYEQKKFEAALPLYGVKKGDDAFLAYMTLGDALSKILISPEGNIVNFNRVCFELQYRDTFEAILSNISAGNSENLKKGVKVDKARNDQDFVIRYKMLTGEDANYSGMARTYRDYLIRNKLLKNSADSTVPLALDLFCGITEKRMLMDKFISMTTFEQAKHILIQLMDMGITSQSVTLKGWSKYGYGVYPAQHSPAWQLGGSKGLTELAEFSGSKGLSLYLQSNPLLAVSGNSGFSVRTEAVQQGNLLPFSNTSNTYYLLTPLSVMSRVLRLSDNLGKWGNVGIALDGIAQFVYEDCRTKALCNRDTTSAIWQETLSRINKKLAVEFGNQYALPYADRLYNIPLSASQTGLCDESVPFYQMVVHGSIAYSSDPWNLFYDKDLQKLKWIEYGCMPYFELTYQPANMLKYTDYNRLYTSRYQDWIDDMATIYNEFNTKLSGIWDIPMVEHERLSGDFVKVTYQNGLSIYINYSDKDIKIDNQTVQAKNYLVVKGG